jgi:DNA-binding NarL/FixJ family response regulator
MLCGLAKEDILMVRVVLADDHKIVRDGLRALLDAQPHVQVVGEAEDGLAAVEMGIKLRPEVVVMDIGMTGLNGIEATRRLVSEAPGVRVIALSMHTDRRFVSEMLAAGASGYLVKDGAFEELTAAIDAVTNGRVYLSQNVAGVVVEDYVRRLGGSGEHLEASPLGRLSPREREVLQLAAEGNSTKEMAALLGLSVKTVETHRRQVMEKLGIYNLAGLIKFAIREGLTTLEP